VRDDKQKAAGKKERACRNRRKKGKKALREKEKRVGRLKKPLRMNSRTGRFPNRSEEGNG
jgi:hypothetical protein